MTPFHDLLAQWRSSAATLRSYAANEQAQVIGKCAAELEAALRQYALEELTLEQAVRESGFSYSAIQKRVASGSLANVGTKGSPRVRRTDLPRKGGTAVEGIAEVILNTRNHTNPGG